MQQSFCAYCNQSATLTKEHLWPASLHKRLYAVNQQDRNYFWLSRLQRDIPSEPKIRDVCVTCNNIILSELDNYICNLFDTAFINLLDRDQEVVFGYNYHLLKRWLLKISYNSARIHNSPDIEALKSLLPYILGKKDRLGRLVQLFVQLVYPEYIDPSDLEDESSELCSSLFYPAIHRVGHMIFRIPGIGQKILRAVHLRSYTFFLAYWPIRGGREEQEDFEHVFTSFNRGTCILKPSKPSVHLVCDGMGAWQSFRESRSVRFGYDDDP